MKRWVWAACPGLLLVWSVAAATRSCGAPVSWDPAALYQCTAQGIPAPLVLAVIRTESGGHPYAIRLNAGRGQSLYPRTHAEALRILRAVTPLTSNIDVGLMQVNVGLWGARMQVTAARLLDPVINLRVGCRILNRALATPGPAWQRLGRYHSGTPARQRAYALRVTRWLEVLRRRRP